MVEQMKPSGIDWIGDIPQSWIISKIKYNTIIPLTDGPHETPVFVDEGVPFYSVDGIQDDNIIYEPCRYISIEDANRFDIKVKPQLGDILMGKAASVGKIAIIDKDVRMQVWSPLAVIRTDETKVHNRYLRYYLLSSSAQVEIDLKSTSNTQKNIAMEDIENITIIKPEIKEQNAIADFLDKQCVKIDSIISDLEKQIETLQKYKKSLILETVTKGLNKNVPMKSSGIDWIGDIPAHWETSKIKYNIGLIGSGTTPESGNPLYYEDGKYNWIQSGDLYKTDYINSTEKQLTALAIKDSPALTYYEKDFVVIAMYGASVGNVSISKIDAYTNQACCVIKAKNNDDIRYLFYYLKAAQDEMLLKAFGGTQPNISQIIIKNLNCLKVPNVEQKSISDYLDDKCGKIDSILKDKQEQLEKIKQHKKSLIYEYVTGKKRVKEATNGN